MLCGAFNDDEVAAQIEEEIIRHGGKINCNLVYHVYAAVTGELF